MPYSLDRITIPEPDFHSEALRFLDICKTECTCPDHWHFLWAALKAAGLRRGIYRQAADFARALQGHTMPAPVVYIAGAADAGTLHVLQTVLGQPSARFTIRDRCRAPLVLASEYANAHGIEAAFEDANISGPAGENCHDIVLIHNTLILMDESERGQALRSARSSLKADGIVLCQARYGTLLAGDIEKHIAAEAASIQATIARTFQNEPAAVNLLLPKIKGYVESQCHSLVHRPGREQLLAEIHSAGFRVARAYPEVNALASMVSVGNDTLNLEAELMVLEHA